MGILEKLFAKSPFRALVEHATKVHQCVELVRPLVDALLHGDFDRIQDLHNEMSRTEHEADLIKSELRSRLSSMIMLSVNRNDLVRFLGYLDDVADAAEDFAVVISLRKTDIHPDVKDDLREFSEQVMKVSEIMLRMAKELVILAEQSFSGDQAQKVLEGTIQLGEEEWKADRLQRKFAKHYYEIERNLDPVTIMFYDKICHTLSEIANTAENTGKFLHMLISHR